MQEQAIEDYKKSEDFKNKILEGDNAAYWVEYEDGRDTVERLYPNLDLSSIIAPVPKERTAKVEPTDEATAPTEEVASILVEVEPTTVEVQETRATAVTKVATEEIE